MGTRMTPTENEIGKMFPRQNPFDAIAERREFKMYQMAVDGIRDLAIRIRDTFPECDEKVDLFCHLEEMPQRFQRALRGSFAKPAPVLTVPSDPVPPPVVPPATDVPPPAPVVPPPATPPAPVVPPPVK